MSGCGCVSVFYFVYTTNERDMVRGSGVEGL